MLMLSSSLVFADQNRLNVLLIVADDLSYDSLEFAGGVAPDVTPNLDQLYRESISFKNAFGTASVCQPSRQSMLTGLLPHNYGSCGFFPIKKKVSTLPSILAEHGYVTGNIHKIHHMKPKEIFGWNFTNVSLGLHDADGVVGRDPSAFAKGLKHLIKAADQRNAPFFLVANSADPHRPFVGDPVQFNDWFFGYEAVELPLPSREYTREEVRVPDTLVDVPGVRMDLARYASSVRRLDDTVGACLAVLDEFEKADSTLVIFVSDNGMPLPFGKFDTYFESNHTPLLIRLPGKRANVNDTHLVSLMDITPTVLDLIGIPVPQGLDGRSLRPLIEGKDAADWREEIVFLRYEDIYYGDGLKHRLKNEPDFTEKLESWGWVPRTDHEVDGTYTRTRRQRCYFDGRFAYIYNDWYREDGLDFAPMGAGVPYPDRAYFGLNQAAGKNKDAADRVNTYLLRAPEELYDWTKDPASLDNLARNPEFAVQLKTSRENLRQWMQNNDDPLLNDFETKIINADN
jgi:N-sulfoglucosamine sulfohydrolase